MKKILFILIALVCAVTACTKEQMISDLPEDINKPEGGTIGATKAKRGVCQSTNTLDFGQKLVDLKANWYYTWGLDPSNTVEGAEFVPMFWGASSVTKDNCDKINKLYEEGRVFYVLGFNEPDLKEESNMSVSDALEKWEFLCQNLDSRIKLVSPAPSYPTRAWLDEFMAGVAQRGLRCDYVAVHMYAGIGTQNYQSVIRDVYNKFGKKIWITEFAPRDETLEWARQLIESEAYRNHRVIILTHSFLATDGSRIEKEGYKLSPRNWPQAVWDKLIYPSKNICLVLCGHTGAPPKFDAAGTADYRSTSALRVDKAADGHDIPQMMFNSQNGDGDWNGNGGDCWLRILEFKPDGKTISVSTFSPLFAISKRTAHMAWRNEACDRFDITVARP